MANQAAGFGIGQDVVDFFGRESRVQRNYNHSEPGAGINELDVIGLVGKEKGQPIAGLKAMPG